MELLEGDLAIDDLDGFLAGLSEIGEKHGSTIQAFDARYVAGRNHLARAVASAERAIEHDDTIARDPAVELLLYAAGRRQIERALEMGVGEGANEAAIVVTGGDETGAIETLRAELDVDERSVIDEPDEAILTDYFDVRDRERAATDVDLETLICERVALLSVEK
ncbi:KEOPS complex subunit Cgi121 [Halovivax gelatinilyticus]|uniref:KEOPS complex subunit Cgi121 n=1 Tax=Halovivax gelatinilyticus TaxID=2961597 RepID=UPI0020CA6DDE|nr:KEOPS complex subunit Cgi121 [Halovivax gelatinilyticus]